MVTPLTNFASPSGTSGPELGVWGARSYPEFGEAKHTCKRTCYSCMSFHFHFISFPVAPFSFNFHFLSVHTFIHFISCHFISFQFIHSFIHFIFSLALSLSLDLSLYLSLSLSLSLSLCLSLSLSHSLCLCLSVDDDDGDDGNDSDTTIGDDDISDDDGEHRGCTRRLDQPQPHTHGLETMGEIFKTASAAGELWPTAHGQETRIVSGRLLGPPGASWGFLGPPRAS